MQHLVGVTQIAGMLRVSRQRAHQLTRREDFPAPVALVGDRKVWERSAVEQWQAATGRDVTDEP